MGDTVEPSQLVALATRARARCALRAVAAAAVLAAREGTVLASKPPMAVATRRLNAVWWRLMHSRRRAVADDSDGGSRSVLGCRVPSSVDPAGGRGARIGDGECTSALSAVLAAPQRRGGGGGEAGSGCGPCGTAMAMLQRPLPFRCVGKGVPGGIRGCHRLRSWDLRSCDSRWEEV